MDEWLKKLMQSMAGVRLETLPFDQVASPQMKDALDKVYMRFLSMPADHAVNRMDRPPIYVVQNPEALKGINDSVAFYMPPNDRGVASGIYITAPFLKSLDVPQALSVLLHEQGHHYATHAVQAAKTEQDIGKSELYARLRRVQECEADHYSAYFFPDHFPKSAGEYLGEALSIARGGQGVATQMQSPLDYHTSDLQRLYRMADAELKKHEPGTIKFNDRCNIVSMPATPAWPPAEVTRER